MASLNEVLHELVDHVLGKNTQAADALREKIDAVTEKPEAETEENPNA